MAKREREDKYMELFKTELRNKMYKEPLIFCGSGHPIQNMCTNPSCRVALTCGEPTCKHCGQNVHQFCHHSISLLELTSTLNGQMNGYKEFVEKVMELDHQMIEFIEESIKSMTSELLIRHLQPNISKWVDNIYKHKQFNALTGAEGDELMNYLAEIRNQTKIRGQYLLKSYKESLQQIKTQIRELKSKIKQKFLQLHPKISSLIVNNATQEYQFLFNNLGNPKKFELLYRGSENNFRAAIFHQKCGNAENTLTLVRTEFNKNIAAFTPYKWHSGPAGYVSNAAGGTWLLSLNSSQLKEKLIPINTNYLILNDNRYGPTFGGGHDFQICDSCHTKNQSYNDTGHSYNTANNKHQRGQALWTALSGATQGYNFRVTEYEVFRVIF